MAESGLVVIICNVDGKDLKSCVERTASGDADALQRLIVHYHGALRRSVHNKMDGDRHLLIDPEDILQQAYTSAFQAVIKRRFSLEEAEDASACFYGWLESIAHCRLRDRQREVRRQKRDVRREVRAQASSTSSYPDLAHRLADDQSTPSRQASREEATAALMSSLARLSEDQRRVIRLRYLESWSVADTARELGKTEAAVHMLCHRGLRALREHLKSISRFLSRL